jgi:SAM-dependent methyltransferase
MVIPASRESYRESHKSDGYGERYDRNYSLGYYAALYREIETPMLERLFTRYGGENSTLLDFACGTGRITRIARRYFGTVMGVDISCSMLDKARTQMPEVRLVNQDITEKALETTFDVVTAFRFFLNAEDSLRRSALSAIHRHLKDGGHLICNIHMNKYSIMGMVYTCIAKIRGHVKHNTLTLDQFKDYLTGCGFEIEEVIWYGLTPRPGHFFSRGLDCTLGAAERFFDRLGINGRFSHSFLVIARTIPSSDKAV